MSHEPVVVAWLFGARERAASTLAVICTSDLQITAKVVGRSSQVSAPSHRLLERAIGPELARTNMET
jgi:hypothetical protein